MNPDYMQEPWFAVLRAACTTRKHKEVAAALHVSSTTISFVLNGTGSYGTGKASTRNLAQRVAEVLGELSWPCPHLTEQDHGVTRMVTATRCNQVAYQRLPIAGGLMALAHWKDCQSCPNRARTAPPAPPAAPKRRQPRPQHQES